MALALVTDVTAEPVTVDELKEHLRLDADEDDCYVLDCITEARQWVEGQTHRAMLTQTWDYFIDYGWPWKGCTHRIDLPLNPVASVTSISYVDDNGDSQTLGASQYTVLARDTGSYIVPAYDVEWPSVRNVPNAITVRFVAGASSAPQALKRAVKVLAGHYYENRETDENSRLAVESLISPYRCVSFP